MRRVSAGSVCVALVLTLRAVSFAQVPDGGVEAVRRALVVARVGPKRTVTVGDLEDRIAEMAPIQRAAYGRTPEAVRRRVLDEVVVPATLLALEADADHVAESQPTSYALDRVLSTAVMRAIRARIGAAAAIPFDEVRAYYDANRTRYDAPERYQVWRILCAKKDEAQSVLDEAKRDPTPAAFTRLARDHSQDKATYLRAGNLGFLTADGASNEPGLRVDPALVRAAQGVRDGELVPAPVAEGDGFAVVWRRGTIAAVKRSVDEVAAQIRDALWKAKLKTETDREIASLRASRLRDLNEGLLDGADLSTDPSAGP